MRLANIGGRAALGPPVPRPQKILAAAGNFAAHAEESNAPLPEEPILFAKLPSALCGPEDDIVIPPGRSQVDWEAELVVVVRCHPLLARRGARPGRTDERPRLRRPRAR